MNLIVGVDLRVDPDGEKKAVGIGDLAGFIDSEGREVVSATTTLSGLMVAQVRKELHHAFGMPIAVVNDVHAHAAGESRSGGGPTAFRRGIHADLHTALAVARIFMPNSAATPHSSDQQ